MTTQDPIRGYPYALGGLEGAVKTVVAYLDAGLISSNDAVRLLKEALDNVDGNIKSPAA